MASGVRADRATVARDAVAGIPGAIGSVPDGMASAVLVGVNPVYGLYASMAGPVGGGLLASTRLMVITTTTASALAAGSALGGFSGSKRDEALFVLAVMSGVFMIGAGALRFGRYTRFVSVSVMTGFLTGVAANIILGQLGDLLGAAPKGSFALAKAVDLLTHPGTIKPTSAAVGLSALVLVAVLSRTRVSSFAAVIALVIPTILALGASSVKRVEDVGTIPTGIPLPHLPHLGLLTNVSLLIGAATIAVIVLVQGAGVAEAAPNPDGSMSDANRDFVAQGVGNVVSGLFRGQPVGGSVGQTALNMAAGARTRWASIFSGLWMLAILVVFSSIVGKVAMPTLAAVLIFAAASSLRVQRIETVLRTARASQIALATTFACTLFLPIAAAVGVGVALSLLLQIDREALDLTVVRLVPGSDGRFVEQPAPTSLPSRQVTMLDVYGSLLFAGARTLQAHLPEMTGATRPVVVLRLRGRTTLGSTAFVVVADYAERLHDVGGHLFLSGVDTALLQQLARSRTLDPDRVTVFEATDVVGDASDRAYRAAEAWLATQVTET